MPVKLEDLIVRRYASVIAPSPAAPTTRVLGGPTLVLLAAVACFSSSFHTLLPVVPVLLERGGPHGAAGAGTAALFVGTAIGELMTPWLLTFWSPKRLLIGGTLLVAVPSLVYLLPGPPTGLMLTAAAIRGFGTGAAIVVCIALLAELAPSNRRGRSIGYFGLATGLTSIVFPSVGVTLLATGHGGVAAVIAFLGGLGSALLALRLPERSAAAPVFATNILGGARRPPEPSTPGRGRRDHRHRPGGPCSSQQSDRGIDCRDRLRDRIRNDSDGVLPCHGRTREPL